MSYLNYEAAFIMFTGLNEKLEKGDNIAIDVLKFELLEYAGEQQGGHMFIHKGLKENAYGRPVENKIEYWNLQKSNENEKIDETKSKQLKPRLATKEEIDIINTHLREDSGGDMSEEENLKEGDLILAFDVNSDFKVIINVLADVSFFKRKKNKINVTHRTDRWAINFGLVYPYNEDDTMYSDFEDVDINSLFS